MTDQVRRVADMLSAPMEAVIIALGTGIAQAQRELDRFALETQREIDQDPVLAEAGLQANFYQIPRAELELTIALALEQEPQQRTAASSAASRALQPYRLRQIQLQPVNAAYANQFNFDVQASSRLKLTVVPVPPPGADGAVTPNLTPDEVIELAQPRLAAAADARLAVNLNSRTRVWHVLQYRLEGDATRRLALVLIDDDTRQIIKAEQES